MPYAENKNKVIKHSREPLPGSISSLVLFWIEEEKRRVATPDSWLVSLIKLVFPVWTSFFDNPMVITESSFRVHDYWAWVRNCILASSALTTKIFTLDSCRVFLEQARIEQANDRLCWERPETTTNGHQVHNRFLLPAGCIFIESVLKKEEVESFVYDEISRKCFVTQSETIHEGRLYFQDINNITNPTCYHWQRLYMKKN